MIDQPNAQEQIPDQDMRIHGNQQPLQVKPEQLIRRDTAPPPTEPFARLKYFWRKDTAYKVVILAVTTVVVAGLIFGIFASVAILQNTKLATTVPNTPPTNIPSTVDLRPTFPTPSGGSGSSTSSQPPIYSTPSFNPPPEVTATPIIQPTAQPGVFAVQITNIPSIVPNGSTVAVEVTGSEANLVVSIQVYYNARPYAYASQPGLTDSNGNAVLLWRVQVYGRQLPTVTATVIAIATNQQGQRIVSTPVSVVITKNTGG